MRFEIGPGGMLLILLGLAGLSAGVFGLGMVAGHEMAGPETSSQPVAAAYPLPSEPSAPAAAPAPPAAANAAAAPSSQPAGTVGAASAPNNPAPAPAVASVPHVKPPAPAAVVGASVTRKIASPGTAVASRAPRAVAAPPVTEEEPSAGAAVAPPSESSESADTADTGTDEGEEATAPPAPAPVEPPRRRLAAVTPPPPPSSGSGPYSVQIDAMMDRTGAQQMAQKIRAKGFEPYIVPTVVGGKTWYRLRVGHYATPEQAQAAESRLHQEFNDNNSAGN